MKTLLKNLCWFQFVWQLASFKFSLDFVSLNKNPVFELWDGVILYFSYFQQRIKRPVVLCA